MVKSDVRNYRKDRSHDIRAVETASKTGLYNCHLNSLGSEPLKSHHCRNLEERQVEVVECIVPALTEIPDEIL